MSYSFILLSGGKGLRLGKSTPKQYLSLAGKPMIVHTLERVDKLKEIDEIIIVCSTEYRKTIEDYIEKYNITKKVIFAEAGETRQDSVYNGLCASSDDMVIIHEAARPFVLTEDFIELIECPFDNVSFTYSIPYTVLKKNSDSLISDILNRDELVNIQLPQKFVKKELMRCHNLAKEQGKIFTEDAGLVKYYSNEPIYCLEGKSYNIKITEYIDLLVGETIYKEKFIGE